MEKKTNNTTNVVIATILSLLGIVSFTSSFIATQSKIETQLTNIQAQIAEVNVKLDKRDQEIKTLTERITVIETEIKKGG